ncbi:MAG: hypothetical protein QXI19_07640 [Candidatus Caldarchaeum sp.]
MEFFIVDPHFLICPCPEQGPLNPNVALDFLRRVVKWAKVLDTEGREIGLSNDCIESLKRCRYSILNRKFLNELQNVCKTQDPQTVVLLPKIVKTLETLDSFAKALSAIDSSDDLCYEIKGVTIAPGQFESRLPQNMRPTFLDMLGHLTFARAQNFFPVAAFENVRFLTVLSPKEKDEWYQEKLLICLYAECIYGAEDSPLPRPIQDEIDIIHDPSSIAPTPARKTLRDAIYSALSRTNGKVVISDDLERQLRKQTDRCRNATEIEKVICALAMVWLPEYEDRRKQRYSQDQAFEQARQKFRQAVSHDITGESESVHNNPELSNQRLVSYDGEMIETFLHVKISPRIYFGVRPQKVDGQKIKYTIVLGHVGHLETARYSASSMA